LGCLGSFPDATFSKQQTTNNHFTSEYPPLFLTCSRKSEQKQKTSETKQAKQTTSRKTSRKTQTNTTIKHLQKTSAKQANVNISKNASEQ